MGEAFITRRGGAVVKGEIPGDSYDRGFGGQTLTIPALIGKKNAVISAKCEKIATAQYSSPIGTVILEGGVVTCVMSCLFLGNRVGMVNDQTSYITFDEKTGTFTSTSNGAYFFASNYHYVAW